MHRTPTSAICICTSIGLSLSHSAQLQGTANPVNARLYTPRVERYTCTGRHGHSAYSPPPSNTACKSAAQCTTSPVDTLPTTRPALHAQAWNDSSGNSSSHPTLPYGNTHCVPQVYSLCTFPALQQSYVTYTPILSSPS
jgi:hypothetical protein